MTEALTNFISSQTVITLAVCDNNIPYTAHCFYAYIPEKKLLVFKSKETTQHVGIAFRNKAVAGTINANKLDKTHIQGVQFSGTFVSDDEEVISAAKKAYYKAFPFALAMTGNIYAIRIEHLKFTNNVLGVMKKEEWRN